MTQITEPGTVRGEQVQDGLSRVLVEVVEPEAPEVDMRAKFPRAGLNSLAGAGVLGCTVSRDAGGGGLCLRQAADIVRQVAESCASTATVLQAHLTAVAVLEAYGPPDLRGEIAAGHHVVSLAMNLLDSDGAVIRQGPVAHLYGHRAWVPAAGEADSYVWSCGRNLYLVPATAPGLLVPAAEQAMGLRGTAATALLVDPVSVPAEALLTEEAADVAQQIAFPWFVTLGAAVSLGIMDRAIAATAAMIGRNESRTRGPSPEVLAELGRMTVRADSVRSMFTQTVERVMWRRNDNRAALLALRAAAVQTAIGVTDLAMKLCQLTTPAGSPGVERRFRDARAAYAVPPTPDTVLEHLGATVYDIE